MFRAKVFLVLGLITVIFISASLLSASSNGMESFLPAVFGRKQGSEPFPTSTVTNVQEPSPSQTPTIAASPSPTVTSSPTHSSTPSPTVTSSPTYTLTPSPTNTNTPIPLESPVLREIDTEVGIGSDSVELKWTRPWPVYVTVIDHYEVSAWIDGTQTIFDEHHCVNASCIIQTWVSTPKDGYWCFRIRAVRDDGIRSELSNEVCHIAGPTAIWAPTLAVQTKRLGELRVLVQNVNGGWHHELMRSFDGGEWIIDETEPNLAASSELYRAFDIATPELGVWCFKARWYNEDKSNVGSWSIILCEEWGPYGGQAVKPLKPEVSYDAPLDYIRVRWYAYDHSFNGQCWNELQEQYQQGLWETVYYKDCEETSYRYFQNESPIDGEWCYRARTRWNDENAKWSDWSDTECIEVN